MAENTNIEVNGQKEMRLIQRFLDMCESHWEGNQRITKERLARKLQSHLKTDAPYTVVVPEKYIKDVELALQEKNIGNVSYPDVQGGQSIFMIASRDSEKVQSILNLVYLNDPTRNKSIKASQISLLAKNLGINVISIDLSGTEFENLDKISADKFYSNNMVGSTELNKDYVIDKQAYNYGRRDMSTLIVELSAYKYLEGADKENFTARLAQAEYDNNMERDFAEAVMMKTPMYLAGTDKKDGSFLYYDGNAIISNKLLKNGTIETFTLDPSNYNNAKDIEIAIRTHTKEIHNMACYTPNEMKDKDCIKHDRPLKGSSTDYVFLNDGFNNLVTELAEQADEIIKYPKHCSIENRIKLKTNYIKEALLSVEKNNSSSGKIAMNDLVEKYITTTISGQGTKDSVLAAQIQLAKEKLLSSTAQNIDLLSEHVHTETPENVKSYAFSQDKALEKTR